jgi:carboxymethylenebutenolidase
MKKISKPLMLLSGTGDARIGASMPGIDSLMKSMGKDYSGTNYQGAIHGFLRAQDDAIGGTRADTEKATEQAANLAATKDAWPKTIAFLRKNLGVK